MEDHWVMEGMYLDKVNIVLVGPPSCFGFLTMKLQNNPTLAHQSRHDAIPPGCPSPDPAPLPASETVSFRI